MQKIALALGLLVVPVIAADNNKIKAKVGEEFTIELPSNPSTGYNWYWQTNETREERTVELVKKEFVSENAEADGSQCGIGGKVALTFKAVRAGETPLSLIYKRIWHQENSENNVSERFDISIDSDE